jgi:3-oxoadipate enol-lactonase
VTSLTALLGHDVLGADDAPPLILGSSLGTTREMWDPQRAALAERWRVIRYDHVGHGASRVPDDPISLEDLGLAVLGLADDLGVPRFHYAGLSLGGMVGMWLAINAPERIDRLVVLCSSAYLPPADAWLERARIVEEHGCAAIADFIVDRWFTPSFAQAHDDVVEQFKESLKVTPPVGYAACCRVIADMDLRTDLAKISAPTMVIAGADDPATPAKAHAKVIAAAIPAARLAVVEHAAHLANVEQPDIVTGLIFDHLSPSPGESR